MSSMAMLPYVVPYRIAAVISSLAAAANGVFTAAGNRKAIRFRLVVLPTLLSMGCSSFGVALLMISDERIIRRALGAFLIVLAVYFFMATKKKMVIRPTFTAQLLVGVLTGLAAGMFNIGGPFMALYLLAATDESEEYKRSLSFNFALTSGWAALTHLFYGNYGNGNWKLAVIGVAGGVAGTFFAYRFFGHLSKKIVSRLTYLLIMVMGMFMLMP